VHFLCCYTKELNFCHMFNLCCHMKQVFWRWESSIHFMEATGITNLVGCFCIHTHHFKVDWGSCSLPDKPAPQWIRLPLIFLWHCRFGVPAILIADQSNKFVNESCAILYYITTESPVPLTLMKVRLALTMKFETHSFLPHWISASQIQS